MLADTRETPGETLTDRELLDRMASQLDHMDEQIHQILAFITDNQEILEKARRLLHNPVSDYLKARPKARKP